MLSQKEFNERVQLNNESITSFWESVVGLSLLAYPELEFVPREKISQIRFIEGLRSAYVKRSLISFSTDKNIAYLLAQSLELEAAECSTPEFVKIDGEVLAMGTGTKA
ncbi:hypothetical protein RF11_11280 [Thelohanellus kitauei]|uniref:Uncharacterized protein n=1 Tax=Thelohanellus kitauei TaxID=669202 RepID=A0A0C2M2B4_THEKT|nr:hypothetical protein RF11_11280 [Thelohanellus kitauei]